MEPVRNNANREILEFVFLDGGDPREAWISYEALCDHFGGIWDYVRLAKAYNDNAAVIDAKALALYKRHPVEPVGLRSADFG